jgi:transcriptional regulator with XRE-family HTH domain
MQVQKLRLKRGWSQQQLAELSGLSVRTIQRIEGGQTASTETLKSLASVFEIDFFELTSEAAMPEQQTPSSAPLDEQLAFQHVRRLRSFYTGLVVYVVVIAALCALNYLKTPQRIWVIWPALGWGLALLIRAARVFEWAPFMGADWEKAQVEKRLGRPL